jgi:hypothetical protein
MVETVPNGFAAETFTLTVNPGRTQEGDSAGISMTLSVTGALTTATPYSFVWTVTDPSGASTTYTQSMVSTTSSWSLTATYPTNFSGASLNLAGIYKISIAETLPSSKPAASGQFQIGLTDGISYQRTYPVSIIGTGYTAFENVTINLGRGPNIAWGFPTSKLADGSGRLALTWYSPPNSNLGNYTVALIGSTVKSSADSQWFILYPTNVTIINSWTSKIIVQRTQRIEFRFNATYLSGALVTSGTCLLNIIEPDGLTSHSVTALYDPILATFRANYTTTLGSSTGGWTWNIAADSLNDGFGNGGPLTPSSHNFNIRSALLNVNIPSYVSVYSPGMTIPISATVIMPNGANFTQGTATATITSSGRQVTSPLSLVYNASSGQWLGSYNVNPNDPSGTWLITVGAKDAYGNSGQSGAPLNVNVPGSTPAWFMTWSFLLVVLVAAGVGVGILILRRKEVTHREVKLDITAIKHQADQVKSDDFLQSIQAQLKKRTERLAAERDAAEKEKHD